MSAGAAAMPRNEAGAPCDKGAHQDPYAHLTTAALAELAEGRLNAPWGYHNRQRVSVQLAGSVYLAVREAALQDDIEFAMWVRQACAQAATAGVTQEPTGPRKARVQVSISPGLLDLMRELGGDEKVSKWGAGAVEWALARREAS